MACGGGLWLIAIIATVILILIQWFLHRKIFRTKKLFSIKIVFVQRTDLETDEEYSSAQLDEIMKNDRYICSIERCDERKSFLCSKI